MSHNYNHWWISISFGFSGLATLIMYSSVLRLEKEDVAIIFISLLISYLAARRIHGCLYPLLRVIAIWSAFCAGFIGILGPLSIILTHGLNKYVWVYGLLGICFAFICGMTVVIAKWYEKSAANPDVHS